MKNKKILAIVFSISILFSTVLSVSANSYEQMEHKEVTAPINRSVGTQNTGDLYSPVESIEEQLEELPESQRKIALEKLLDTGEKSKGQIFPYAATYKTLPNFTVYKQSESYYCVVASCKAAMQYLTGSSSSQSTIASKLGTTTSGTPFGNAKTYLNNNQSKNAYVTKAASTPLETMKTNFYAGIYTMDAPPLISVKFNTSGGWAYKTDGHTMCIYGARSDKAYFKIADSYILWADSNASMFYTKSANKIHTAISDRGNGYIY